MSTVDPDTVQAQGIEYRPVRGTHIEEWCQVNLTQPLVDYGVEVDGQQAAIVFNDPDDAGWMIGDIRPASDVPGADQSSNVKTTRSNNGKLSIFLSGDDLAALGVDTEATPTEPVVIEIVAGGGLIGIRQMQQRDVEKQTLDEKLWELPDQMREDYVAVVEEDYTPDEWADERELSPREAQSGTDEAAVYIRRNVKAAKEILNDRDGKGRNPDSDGVRGIGLVWVSRQHIRSDLESGYSVPVSKAIRRALPEAADANEIGVEFDFDPDGETGMLTGTVAADDDIGNVQGTERWVTVEERSDGIISAVDGETTWDYRCPLPMRGVGQLDFNINDVDGAPVHVYAGKRRIGVDTPEIVTISTTQPQIER